MLNPIHVFTITDFSKFHVNQSRNKGAIQVTTYLFKKLNLLKKWFPWKIFMKINPIHAFSINENFPKFHVYPSTNVGAIQATTCYDTNLAKSPSQKLSDSLDRFFWKSIPSMLLLLLTTSQSFMYIHQQM
jgi:hypothetical protein